MEVLVDTSVWSLALRRPRGNISETEQGLTVALGDLIRDDRVRLIGPIRQELLSGIREPAQYDRLRDFLRAFPDQPLGTADYEQAAQCSNQCRSRGVAGSAADFLICAVALARKWQILTTDADFKTYAKAMPIAMYPLAGRSW
ncbi:MAG: PIN domain-containing protein [Bryobacteraceae bacterium]